MTDEEKMAKTISDTLAWACRQASLPAITDITQPSGNEFFLTDTFEGTKFRVTVTMTD